MHPVDVQPEDQDAYDLAHREAKAAMPDLWPVLQHREPEQVVLLFLVVKELDSPGEVLDRRVRAVTRDYVLQKDPEGAHILKSVDLVVLSGRAPVVVVLTDNEYRKALIVGVARQPVVQT